MNQMKASELRLGNWVIESGLSSRRNNSNPYQIAYQDLVYPQFLEPIRLTPEWLERFGFKKIDGYWYKGFFALRNGEYFEIIDIWIAHVHQLQNLYFALTGEELNDVN